MNDGLEVSYATEDKNQLPSVSARFRVRNGVVQVRFTSEGDEATVRWVRIQIPVAEWHSIVSFINAELEKAGAA